MMSKPPRSLPTPPPPDGGALNAADGGLKPAYEMQRGGSVGERAMMKVSF